MIMNFQGPPGPSFPRVGAKLAPGAQGPEAPRLRSSEAPKAQGSEGPRPRLRPLDAVYFEQQSGGGSRFEDPHVAPGGRFGSGGARERRAAREHRPGDGGDHAEQRAHHRKLADRRRRTPCRDMRGPGPPLPSDASWGRARAASSVALPRHQRLRLGGGGRALESAWGRCSAACGRGGGKHLYAERAP